MASSNIKSFYQNPLDENDLRDYRHASKVFVTNAFRLAPKSKFNFFAHVILNTDVVSTEFLNRHSAEVNVLLKAIHLPKYDIKTETLNQYNRKKVVQVTSAFRPLRMVFHDDNYGVTRMLWEEYYKYHYADPTSALNPDRYYTRSAMKNFNANSGGKYGLDNGGYQQFFKKIIVYHMGVNVNAANDESITYKHGWNSYTYINPVIAEWSHDDLDHSIGNELSKHELTIHYEAVAYNTGETTKDSPPIFADSQYYFTEHSPLLKK